MYIANVVIFESANHEVSTAENLLHCKVACTLWVRELYGIIIRVYYLSMVFMYLVLYIVELLLNYAVEYHTFMFSVEWNS